MEEHKLRHNENQNKKITAKFWNKIQSFFNDTSIEDIQNINGNKKSLGKTRSHWEIFRALFLFNHTDKNYLKSLLNTFSRPLSLFISMVNTKIGSSISILSTIRGINPTLE